MAVTQNSFVLSLPKSRSTRLDVFISILTSIIIMFYCITFLTFIDFLVYVLELEVMVCHDVCSVPYYFWPVRSMTAIPYSRAHMAS